MFLASTLSDGVAVVTIERAHKANSLPQAAKAAVAAEVERWTRDAGADAIVLTGEGGQTFCAGSDINEMRFFGMAEMDRMLVEERRMYLAVLSCPKPVVAAVNGFALGAGLILAMSCDYTVAAPHAVFGAPELTIGVAAPLEGLLLPYFVGLARARALFYTGARLSSEEAVAVGLVNEVAPADGLIPRAVEVARAISGLPGSGFRVQKALLHRLLSTGDLETVIRESHHLTARQFAGPETGEAMRQFLDRRHGGATPKHTRPGGAEGLVADERQWLDDEARHIEMRSAALAGEAAWHPADQEPGEQGRAGAGSAP
ncbi:enoyl-CoA hydratase/isomerase family protein [Georgenia sp. AZ-5]|uniref:enoyl-CoA hydratase/isomerase family protein n=1 Tax=Georgenia sp. AZ-5 TaxID=3367526 RepID=UPI00375524AD